MMINSISTFARRFRLVGIIGLVLLSNTSFSQNKPDTITRLDYFNLEGEFIRKGSLYVDSVGLLYGIADEKRCQWDTFKVIGKRAIVKDRPIAIYKTEGQAVTLNYPTGRVVHLKLKQASFESFLKENTLAGDLVESENIRINGKHPKLYSSLRWNTKKMEYRLSSRINETKNPTQ